MELEGIDESTMNKYDRPDNRKSLIGRFRKVRKAQTPTPSNKNDKRDQTPSPPLESYPTATARREGAPSKILVAQSSDSTALDAVKSPTTPIDPWDRVTRETKSKLKSSLPIRESVTLSKPPSAQEAAFGGPPRFDWIDIVSFFHVSSAYVLYSILCCRSSSKGSTTRRLSWWKHFEVLALNISHPTLPLRRIFQSSFSFLDGVWHFTVLLFTVLSDIMFLHT
jgi:hypothetical protein